MGTNPGGMVEIIVSQYNVINRAVLMQNQWSRERTSFASVGTGRTSGRLDIANLEPISL
jgi:hypothetical protein